MRTGQVAMGSFPKNRPLFHLPDVGKEGDVGSRSRTQSLTPIPFLVTSQLGTKEGYLIKQGKIVKVRKTRTPCFHSAVTHRSWRQCGAEIAPPAFPCREEQFVF